jgi:transformation/transcription domain-associated protein
VRKKATDAIKDSQELWHTKEYRRFLEVFFDPLVSQLTSTPPQFEDSELHKLRHSVLEVLSKLPPNDVLRPYMPRLLALCLELLRNDNQANGVLAIRVLLDLNKNLVRSQVAGFENQFSECVAFIEKVSPAGYISPVQIRLEQH